MPWQWDITAKWKWLALALFIKGALFAYFAIEFQHNWEAKHIQNGVVIFYQDSYTYYIPVEEWVDGKGYRGACRMPGFLPIYAPLYSVFGASTARLIMIVLQVLMDVLTTYLLALFAYRMRSDRRVFLWTFTLAALSSFVSVWNNYAVSDSWAVSTLILAFYCLQRYGAFHQSRHLLWAGVWMCWSIFFRPIHLLALPVVAIHLVALHGAMLRNFKRLWIAGLAFIAPLTVCIGLWTWRNQEVYQKWIPLQDDPSACYYNLQDYHLALRDNILAWGMDFQEWSRHTEFAWFLDSTDHRACPLPNRVYTTYFNADSLQVLKDNYHQALATEDHNPEAFAGYRAQVMQSAKAFQESYVEERPFDFYLINRFRLLRLFLFSGRVDNLPLPARQDMNVLQFAFKVACLAMLTIVLVLGMAGAVLVLWRGPSVDRWLLVYPLLHIAILGAVLGYAEQRYLTPAYPFLVVASALVLPAIGDIWSRWRKSRYA